MVNYPEMPKNSKIIVWSHNSFFATITHILETENTKGLFGFLETITPHSSLNFRHLSFIA